MLMKFYVISIFKMTDYNGVSTVQPYHTKLSPYFWRVFTGEPR